MDPEAVEIFNSMVGISAAGLIILLVWGLAEMCKSLYARKNQLMSWLCKRWLAFVVIVVAYPITQVIRRPLAEGWFTWLKKWGPLLIFAIVLTVAWVKRAFLFNQWYFTFPAVIILNQILAHRFEVSFSEQRRDWVEGRYACFFGNIFFFWATAFFLYIPEPEMDDDEAYD